MSSTIVFASNRDNPTLDRLGGGEIYLLNPDGTDLRRLTTNSAFDIFPVLSPDGKQIVFDSHRDRPTSDPANTSDLFLMQNDGTHQRLLTQGSSATWSPDSKSIAFHASASGRGEPINADLGAATLDSDIFVARVGDLLDFGPAQRTNITNSAGVVDSDADWSPAGNEIAFDS
ncbi:MAG: PD40 domain-containing protein, partial [Mycobacterium sp.]|nr:PD40 domain-containing protein [Mycobacterium sp.]